MWWDAFDTTVTTEHLHAAGSSAAAEILWRGRHIGPFYGIEATGRPVELPVAVVFELGGGLVTAERLYWDRALLAEQLDVDPRALDVAGRSGDGRPGWRTGQPRNERRHGPTLVS